ncbi:YhgE/Pip domain-containing protein [Salisediminibacterium selenitireducens]|uniref:YhgE/Pip N-terminal domain protein n=1 Tax=Bacillus selenitireducens (strain ATCC 700615 / DSM 15326 / MLS10) TaxID=439292 RepID=D6Y0H5_BACIE|nr:YhgE/Pip domain-containing protein [Salisediminibacterium selenitireducens]ADH98566.1 YhgE/Pip N-terminal domain protein [[Bacillus] selenitireducens MLS10]
MRNVMDIFKQDVRNMRRVPLVAVLLVGLAILPSLYAWFNLSASWDPYGNTGGVSVAVVNEDKGVTVDGETVNIGSELEASLRDNEQLGWTIVENGEARKGVEQGDYYAAVKIPEDFSETLLSVLDGEPVQSTVHYVVNEKVNAIAPKMTDSGASTITREINEQFSKETSSLMFEAFDELGIQLEEELPTFRRIRDVVMDLESQMPKALSFGDTLIQVDEDWDRLDGYVDEILAFEEQFPVIEAYAEQVIVLDERLDEADVAADIVLTLEGRLPEIEAAIDDFTRMTEEIPAWSDEFEDILDRGEALPEVGEDLQAELRRMQSELPAYEKRLDEWQEELAALSDAAGDTQETLIGETKALYSELDQLKETLEGVGDHEAWDEAADAVQDVNRELSTYDARLASLEETIVTVLTYTSSIDLEGWQREIASLRSDIESVQDELSNQADAIRAGSLSEEALEGLVSSLDPLLSSVGDWSDVLESEEELIERLIQEAATVIAGEIASLEEELVEDVMKGFVTGLDAFMTDVDKTLSALLRELDETDPEEFDEAFAERIETFSDRLTPAVAILEEAESVLEALMVFDPEGELEDGLGEIRSVRTSIAALTDELTALEERLSADAYPGEEAVLALIRAIDGAKEDVAKANDWLSDEAPAVLDGIEHEIEETLDAMRTRIGQADDLLRDLDEGAERMLMHYREGLDTARGAVGPLSDAEDQLKALADELNRLYPEVERQITRMAGFADEDLPRIQRQVAALSERIRTDLPEWQSSYEELADWLDAEWDEIGTSVATLADFARDDLRLMEEQVREVSESVREIEEDERIQEVIDILRNDLAEEEAFFASPVVLSEEQLFPIPNYGSANVPFYTPLALWVGALLLSNLVTTNLHEKDRKAHYSLRDIYFGRGILFMIVAVMQGLIVSFGNLFFLGVYAAHPGWMVVFSVIIAVVFMTIVYTLASILGNIGKALAIVFLVLQLSGGGGTFPIEVTPPFFQAIHPYLPFTYAINLLREAVGGMLMPNVLTNLMMLGFFWLLAMVVGMLLKPLLAKRIEETYNKSKSSRLVE